MAVDPLDALPVIYDYAELPPDGFHKDADGNWVDEEGLDEDNSVLETALGNALPMGRSLSSVSAAVRMPQVKALGPLRREIRAKKVPMRGLDVAAVHRALARAGCAQWKKGGVFSWVAGPFFFRSLGKFQKKMGLKVDFVYGNATHRELGRFFDALAIKRYQDAKIGLTGVELKRQRLRSTALYLIHNRHMVGYTMTGLRMTIIRKKLSLGSIFKYGPIWEDCSSSVRGIYYLIGAPDIMGYGYGDSRGYTGTMSNTGRSIRAVLSLLKIGDAFLTGPGNYSHTWMYIGSGWGYSHGKMSDPRIVPWDYRPIRRVQRYLD